MDGALLERVRLGLLLGLVSFRLGAARRRRRAGGGHDVGLELGVGQVERRDRLPRHLVVAGRHPFARVENDWLAHAAAADFREQRAQARQVARRLLPRRARRNGPGGIRARVARRTARATAARRTRAPRSSVCNGHVRRRRSSPASSNRPTLVNVRSRLAPRASSPPSPLPPLCKTQIGPALTRWRQTPTCIS